MPPLPSELELQMLVRVLASLSLILVPGELLLTQAPVAPPRTAVPIKTVVLFSSGVGYFEHAGTVRGNGSTQLHFRTSQINDVLKSLVLQDRDGGFAGAITYPSQDPLGKTLRSFQVDITSNPSLADLLNQLRGARVTVQARGERMSGTILGVEQRRKPVATGEPVEVPVLNLLTGATIRAVDLPTVSSLSLDDPQLQDELTKALSVLSQARGQDKKPVTINFTGTGDRRVRVGYVVETPVWKTSYRLILGDRGVKGNPGSTLQGWAIVENETESDWSNVALSLVSGRPISFKMDLYQPLYATRPTVVPEMYAGLRPQLYEGATTTDRERVEMKAMEAPAPAPAVSRSTNNMALRGGQALAQFPLQAVGTTTSAATDLTASVRSLASATDLGELFEYNIANVTLPRQKSAMLPIIADTIGVERVSIYNASVLPTHPLYGVRFKNTTGKRLLQGPVTVIDHDNYAGDARIDNVGLGQERLLSYGIDLDLLVDETKNTQTTAVSTARIVGGALHVTQKFHASQEYRVDNKGEKDKVVVIERPIRPGWKLVDTQTPIETTPALYRFQGNAAAKKVTTLTVNEENFYMEAMSLSAFDMARLATYSSTGEIPQAVRDVILKAMTLRQGMLDTERQIADRVEQLGGITQEQVRIREDMKTVAPKTPYYTRLLAKLNDQETSIERLQKEREELTRRLDKQRKELEDYLRGMNVG